MWDQYFVFKESNSGTVSEGCFWKYLQHVLLLKRLSSGDVFSSCICLPSIHMLQMPTIQAIRLHTSFKVLLASTCSIVLLLGLWS